MFGPNCVPDGIVSKTPASSPTVQPEMSISSGEYISTQSCLSVGDTENSLITTCAETNFGKIKDRNKSKNTHNTNVLIHRYEVKLKQIVLFLSKFISSFKPTRRFCPSNCTNRSYFLSQT